VVQGTGMSRWVDLGKEMSRRVVGPWLTILNYMKDILLKIVIRNKSKRETNIVNCCNGVQCIIFVDKKCFVCIVEYG
jgi:hypothetical protein